ncbi:sigma-70 family RNA polymerase sigma factor [Myroides sp. DF42-4-2]|uniref:RNA polymerase sigma factor n=1 Tax=unclassified Myroides TaxID=2642485 RepID=UPI0025786EE9|nr:sigma-70 family RNA polymerase sigma factor [Myroides sp. DF42-4-2]MDM1407058.1 sigma-70 family RNA polymerase sigma factor [Myroides sp. DF42-4-2]
MSKRNDYLLDQIYLELWKPLYSYAYTITKDSKQSEDIIQEIFIDLWKRIDQLEVQNIKSYLYAAVKYKSFEYMRKRPFTTNELETAYQALQECDLMTEEEQQLFKAYLLAQIKQKAEELLPEKCYQAFQLRFYAEQSYAEIAQVMNISEHTVKNHIVKALQTLRANLPYSIELIFLFVYLC